MDLQTLKNIIEAILLSADKPLDVRHLETLFEADADRPSRDEIRQALAELQQDYEGRGTELKEISSGFRMQVRQDYAQWVGRLWEEKPARYSRALLETLVLIAYRQPITRGEIEEIRGVSVSTHIAKTLLEREWIRVLGHKDVPGKPAMYGTTKEFLDYFNLKTLNDLPPLSDIKDLDKLHPELALGDDVAEAANDEADQGENNQDLSTIEDERLTTESSGEISTDNQADSVNEEPVEQNIAENSPENTTDSMDEESFEDTVDAVQEASEA